MATLQVLKLTSLTTTYFKETPRPFAVISLEHLTLARTSVITTPDHPEVNEVLIGTSMIRCSSTNKVEESKSSYTWEMSDVTTKVKFDLETWPDVGLDEEVEFGGVGKSGRRGSCRRKTAMVASDSPISSSSISSSVLSPPSPPPLSPTSSSPSSSSSLDSDASVDSDAPREPPLEIIITVFHSQSKPRSNPIFLGHCRIPLSSIATISKGAFLIKEYDLLPKEGETHRFVSGKVVVKLQSVSVFDVLQGIIMSTTPLQSNSNFKGVGVLERSRNKRENTDGLSKKVDGLLDHYYNNLESSALSKVDKQLISAGLFFEQPKGEVKVGYLQSLMKGSYYNSMNGQILSLIESVSPSKTKPTQEDESQKSEEEVKTTALGRRNLKESKVLHSLQPLNQGLKERKLAIFKAMRKANRLKSWVRYSESSQEGCEEYVWADTNIGDSEGFGIAVQLHFGLMLWFSSLAFFVTILAVYLTYLTSLAYVNELEDKENKSVFLPLSIFSFANSNVPLSYQWVLCVQVVITIGYMMALRLMIYRKSIIYKEGISRTSDFGIMVKDLPVRGLIHDSIIEKKKDEDVARAEGNKSKSKELGKMHHHHKDKDRHHHHDNFGEEEKKKKKNTEKEDYLVDSTRGITSQDVKDHFSTFGPIIHVALSFNVNRFWSLLKEKDILQNKVIELHQLKAIRAKEGGPFKSRSRDVKHIEETLTTTYKNLSMVKKRLRAMDAGERFQTNDGSISAIDACCACGDQKLPVKTTGTALVMFRYRRDKDMCLKLLNSTPPSFFGLSYSRAGINIANIMREGRKKVSSWTRRMGVCKAPEPNDIVWQNLEFDRKAKVTRNAIVFVVSLIVVALGFLTTIIVASVKLKLSRVCRVDSSDRVTYEGWFVLIDEFAGTLVPLSLLPEYSCDYGIVTMMTLLSSIIIAVNNMLISKAIHAVSKFERSHHRSNELAKLVFRITLAQYLNTTLSMFFTYQPFVDWGNAGNLIDAAVLFMFVNIFISVADLFVNTVLYPIFQKRSIEKAVTTSQLNAACLPPNFDIEFKYAYVVCTYMSAQFFFAVIPALMLLVSLAFMVAAVADKYQLLYVVNSKNLIFYDEAAAKMALDISGPLIVLTSVAGFIICSTVKAMGVDRTVNSTAFLQTLQTEAYQPYSLIILIMCVLYLLLPLYRDFVVRHNIFKRKEGTAISMPLMLYRRLLGKKDVDEAKEIEDLAEASNRARYGAEVRAGAGLRHQAAAVVKEVARNATDVPEDFYLAQKKNLSYMQHYQAPTPTCMTPYQKVDNSLLTNISIDASVVLDSDGDGKLDADEFTVALANLGVNLLPFQANAIVELYDIDGDGTVSTEEFMSAASAYSDDYGLIDYHAFARGVVKELEEEFGGSLGGFISQNGKSTSLCDGDAAEDGNEMEAIKVEDVASGVTTTVRITSFDQSVATPPFSTDNVMELERMISKTWKVEYYEKNKMQLDYEDYDGTGFKVPPVVFAQYLGNKARAARAYHASGTSSSMRVQEHNSSFTHLSSTLRSPGSKPSLISPGISVTATPDSNSRERVTGLDFVGKHPASSSGFGAITLASSSTEASFLSPLVKSRGFWKDGKYVSAQNAEFMSQDEQAASILALGSKLSPRRSSIEDNEEVNRMTHSAEVDDDLSAKVLNFAVNKGKDAKTIFSHQAQVEKFVDAQKPSGNWELTAAVCVQLRIALTTAMNAKPAGCLSSVWATELVLASFDLTYLREKQFWLLSSKMAIKWLSKRADCTPNVDFFIKKAARYVMMVATNYEKPVLDDSDSDDSEDNPWSKDYEKNKAKKREISRAAIMAEAAEAAKYAEEDRKRKLHNRWKASSFLILKKMSGKEHHLSSLNVNNIFETSSDEEESTDSGEKDENASEGEGSEKMKKSKQFNPKLSLYDGDIEPDPLRSSKRSHSPSSKKTVRPGTRSHPPRPPPSTFTAPPALPTCNAIQKRRAPAIQSLGLKCKNSADPNLYVEIKLICARHFLCRIPSVPPTRKRMKRGKEDGKSDPKDDELSPTLVCVSHFGTQESSPVAICAGGAPPGYQADTLRFHISSSYHLARFNLFQVPIIPIGYVTLDLEEELPLLTDDFKTFVVDICPVEDMGVDEKMGRGGYFGQVAMSARINRPPVTTTGGSFLKEQKENAGEGTRMKTKAITEAGGVQLTDFTSLSVPENLARESAIAQIAKIRLATKKDMDDKSAKVKIKKELRLKLKKDERMMRELPGKAACREGDKADDDEDDDGKTEYVDDNEELSTENKNLFALLNGDVPSHLVTKRYNISTKINEKKFKKFPCTFPSPGTYNVISSSPGFLVPMNSEIEINMGSDQEAAIRVMIVPCKHFFKSETTVIIRRDDGLVIEILKFAVEFTED